MKMSDKVLRQLIGEIEEKLYWKELSVQRLSSMKTLREDLEATEKQLAVAKQQIESLKATNHMVLGAHKLQEETRVKLHALVDAAAEIMPFISTRTQVARDLKAKLVVATTDGIDFHGREEMPF